MRLHPQRMAQPRGLGENAPHPELLLGIPDQLFATIFESLSPNSKKSLFDTCRQTRDAILRTTPSLTFSSLRPRDNNQHERNRSYALLASAASRGSELDLKIRNSGGIEGVFLHGSLPAQPRWNAVGRLTLSVSWAMCSAWCTMQTCV